VAFPPKLLNDGEQVVLDLRPHWIYMAEPSFATLGAVIVGLIALKIGKSYVEYPGAALLVFCLAWFGIRYAKWSNTNFVVTTQRVIHRVGLLRPLDQIVMVVVTSAHRGESFAACEFLMDYLKTQAPFWKKEQTPDGAKWVDARVSDDAALAKWGIVASNS
jgi:hypothetical protein